MFTQMREVYGRDLVGIEFTTSGKNYDKMKSLFTTLALKVAYRAWDSRSAWINPIWSLKSWPTRTQDGTRVLLATDSSPRLSPTFTTP